ncbi:DUF4864 domain-containing protein [Pontibacter sp. 172403-2]|uniref:DUF4864 domain-containing protein n=1 Tax=Pontibacter rufus TaxID=2791028 RepID=UPI0018AFCE2D|nr:DUF4864 domain-containing protein [Pontibacter sp. 172403-2]MBF9255303.1 DUF4864 domain-containing protein [Pontibacter sp. 172403-2]
MKRLDNVFDKLMLATGLLLLVWFWAKFPPVPTPDRQEEASYITTDAGYTAKWTHVRPDKGLSPREVIRIQLLALQQNDHHDSGVITVFNFSSPVNRMHLGPINHFRMLVRDPAYSSILNFRKYRTGQLVITGNMAYQLVVITDRDGQQAPFLFILARQTKGKYKGCWMTEGVARMAPQPQSSLV